MTMPPRLTEVGELERPDHHYLPTDTRCFFWGEYTPYEHTNGKKWNFSPTNQLMSNFKKKLDRRGQSDWRYKADAIQRIGRNFAGFWNWLQLREQHRVCLIPIPPSKARTDPMYDSRVLDVLRVIAATTQLELDIRDCLSFSGQYAASHESEERPTPDQLFNALTFEASQGLPQRSPGLIFVFDDMLTTGAHFVAVRRLLTDVFPGVPLVGQFVARRRLPNPFEDFEE